MVLPGEYGLPTQELCEDTPNGPQIDPLVIVLCTKDYLRCAVPSRHNILRQGLSKLKVLINAWQRELRLVDAASKAKVTYFQIAIRVDQQVAWLYVSVHNVS